MRGQPLSEEIKERMREGRRLARERRLNERFDVSRNGMTQAERDAEYMIGWLKAQTTWANEDRRLIASDAMQRRYYEAFLAMPEEKWRLFVMIAFTRRMPMLPPLPAPTERERGAA